MNGLEEAPVIAEVVRGEVVESVHRARVVVTAPDGSVLAALGDLEQPFYARSSLKPLQGLAMLRAGLELPPALLSLACGSHAGEPMHLTGVAEILGGVQLPVSSLRNTPDVPGNPEALFDWQLAGRGPESIAQNCSGQHAAMVRTCVLADWPLDSYLDPTHPLQVGVAETLREQTGGADQLTVDGCGAPLYATPLAGLARAFGRLAAAESGSMRQIADAMRSHPLMMSGTGRWDAALMTAAPGVLSKGGAEGCWLIGLPDGHGIALKSEDGAPRGVHVAALRLLADLGIANESLAALGVVPVLGNGRPVGEVRPSARIDQLLG